MDIILEQIEKNTSHKSSFQIILNSTKSSFLTKFSPAIELDKSRKYEIALINLETYYSFPNITQANNKFRYSPDRGHNWFDITIPTGCYEIADLNRIIQQSMKSNNHWDHANESYYITLGANTSTLKCVLNIGHNYFVDFRPDNSLNTVLGFNSTAYRSGYHESENVVNIMSINSILVNVDIINGSYVNGTQQPTIYSFFPNVPPGHKIIESPRNLVYLPIVIDNISSINTSITDNHGKILDLRGEHITMRFHIREI